MCATFKACEMLPRSAPNLSLVNLPHLLLCPNTSSSEVCTDICDYFCSSPLHTFFPDCLGNSQYPVRGSPSVNFSKLNPTQGVHLSTCPERLSSRPWTCSRCPGAWPSLAAHYAEAPQRAVCARIICVITSDATERLNEDSQPRLPRLLLQGMATRRQVCLKPNCDYLRNESFREF